MSLPSYIRTSLLAVSAAVFSCATSFAATPVLVPHLPTLVTSGTATKLAAMDQTQTLDLAIGLAIHNQAGLDALLADLYNPQSANYHQWLTSQEFNRRFGPTAAETQAVIDWAKSEGLTVGSVAPYGRVVSVSGSVAVINHAFHITETMYHDPNLNRDFHAPDVEPTTDLPFAINSVDNLENSAPMHNYLKKGPTAGIPSSIAAPVVSVPGDSKLASVGVLKPVRPAANGSGPDGTFLPSDIRAAYYGSGNLTGSGQSVGVFSYEGIYTGDLALFYSSTSTTMTVPVTYVNTGTGSTPNCTAACDDGEQVLDIANVEGMAPGLTGVYFFENGSSAQTELASMVSYDNIKVFTNSWGGGNFGTASDTYFEEMATQGQTYFSATGDDGGLNKADYDAPSLDPYIVQVGGTDLEVTGAGGAWVSEVAWPDSTGGYWITGISTTGKYTIPTWQSQTGVVTTTNKASATYRNIPDMAAEANFDNPTADEGEFLLGYGGTSFATPRMAGYFALANQQLAQDGTSTGLGAIMPGMYTAGLAQQNSTGGPYYHDITSGNNESDDGTTTTYYAVAGYDNVTGWGSPDGPALLNYFAPAPASFTLPGSVAGSVLVSSTVTFSIPITGYNGYAGTAAVTAVSGLPSGWTYSSTSGTTSTPATVTLTAPSSYPPGTFNVVATLTDTATSTLTQTTTLAVSLEKRAAGDFTMSATAASVEQGGKGSSTISVTASTGLAGPIALALTGIPSGITATLYGSTTQPDVYTTQNFLLSMTAGGATTPGTYTVTVTGTAADGIVHTASTTLTVVIPTNYLGDGSFETNGSEGGAVPSPWATTTSCGYAPELLADPSGFPPQDGNYFALLDGIGEACTETLTQSVTIPFASSGKATLGFWQWFLTNETSTTTTYDYLTTTLVDDEGTSHTLGTLSDTIALGNNPEEYWTYQGYDISAYQGTTVTIKFTAVEAGATITDILLDNVSVTAP